MSLWQTVKNLFSKDSYSLTPEFIEDLPSYDDAKFYQDSKKLLQRFDEYITSGEAESEELSILLDETLSKQESIKSQIVTLNKANSWHERSMLLKLDRISLYGENLKTRIEIYAQNIKVYLNLMSKIEDIKAMKMNGLSEEKIETIWVEFRETASHYRDKLLTETSEFQSEQLTTVDYENRISKLRKSLFPEEPKEKPEKKQEIKDEIDPPKVRPPLAEFLSLSKPEEPEKELVSE